MKIPIQKLQVAPTYSQLKLLAKALNIKTVSASLHAWSLQLLKNDPNFESAKMNDRFDLAAKIEERFNQLSFDDIAKFSMVPLPRGENIEETFMMYINDYIKSDYVSCEIIDTYNLTIDALEFNYAVNSIYCWLSRVSNSKFKDYDVAYNMRSKISDLLIEALKHRAKLLIKKIKSSKK